MATALNLSDISWPVNRLGELIENLARKAGYASRPVKLPQPPDQLADAGDETISRWIDVAAGYLGLEAEQVESRYSDTAELISSAGPVILRLPGPLSKGEARLVAIVRGNNHRVSVLKPDLRQRKVATETLRSALCEPYEGILFDGVNALLKDAGVPEERQKYAARAILREQLSGVRVPGGWMLKLSPGASLWTQFRHNRVYLSLAITLFLYLVQQLLAIGSWFVIGRGFFQGNYDIAWLLAWGLLLFATIPVQILVSDAQTELSLNVGSIFKQRLMHGTLQLEPEEIRHQGMGQFLSRVMESEAVEFLAMNGGFLAVLSFIELTLAAIILANGAGGLLQAGILFLWVLITLGILWRYYQKSKDWTNAYRQMTNELVEHMVGHRTRLAQEDRTHWHDGEDLALDHYLTLSEDMDRIGIQLNAVISRGWLLVGLASTAIPYILGNATPQALAISLGGVIYASQALSKLAGGVQSFIGLLLAWRQVGPLFQAAARPRDIQALDTISRGLRENTPMAQRYTGQDPKAPQPLLLAKDISFRYRATGKPILDECTLDVFEGDRILIEGPSGGGKSTLAALLTGLRAPESGTLLLWGYDRQILGSEEWRRRVVMAPQFQENYVFTETFGFNLLMGRGWPASEEDLAEAETICRELGLGEVLDRMPSGFQQMLGESGWQLSHGEKSRLYIARTLLQNADVVVFDESFGALDPENLQRSLECVLRRAPTLLVIAHP